MSISIGNLEKYFCILFLLAFFLPSQNLWALDPGEPVYEREAHNGGNWMPATYVGARSDCLVLERLLPFPWKAEFLKVPADIQESSIAVGQEVREVESTKPLPNSKMKPLVDRVLAVQQKCHEVKHAGGTFSRYVLPGNILKSSEFHEMRGSRQKFSVGDKVYARKLGLEPEQWSLRTVIAERDDCYETESDKVLCGHYVEDEFLTVPVGQLFMIPPKISKKIKKGDSVDGLSIKVEESVEGAAYSRLEGSVKAISKDTLTLKSYSEDCSYEPVRIENLRDDPAPLPAKNFATLKIGDQVLEIVEMGCCCCKPFFKMHKITSPKRSGYLLQNEGEIYSTEASISSQLLPAEALDK